jgi:NDP-sugar pyrophosphorylase family protein
MNDLVIISTAGLGSRMRELTENLNKSLLPYKNKPVISHIIESFSKNSKFIILTGHLSDQVRSFCSHVYQDRNIEFVDVDDYTSEKSGPGYSFLQCIDKIDKPFWYVPCDTYFEDEFIDKKYDENTYFTKKVDIKLSNQYTMFDIDDNRIKKIKFKQQTSESYVAFTGLMFINDWKVFIEHLKNSSSNEIISPITLGEKVANLESWIDFGNYETYKDAYVKSQKYVFSKEEEITYFTNNFVIKWWQELGIAEKKYSRYIDNTKVYPSNVRICGNYLFYDYLPGSVIYKNYNLEIFKRYLNWIDENLWIRKSFHITHTAEKFYKDKTISRVHKFLSKYQQLPLVKTINDIEVEDWNYYFDKIDWNLLVNEVLPGHVHGDLHFDNSIISDNGEFKLIDWRPDFGGSVECGDIYYDLAKLMGGLIINYSKIKENEFEYSVDNGSVRLIVPSIENADNFVEELKNFILNKGWNYKKVKLLVPIIFWNMSPLHHRPFDLFLWYLGIKLFKEIDDEKF